MINYKPDILKILENCVLFNGMNSTEISKACNELDGNIRDVEARSVYINSGDHVLRTSIVLEGSINICMIDSKGDLNLVDKLKPGYLCGMDIACTGSGISPYDYYAPQGVRLYEFDFIRLHDQGYLEQGLREKMIWNLILFLSNNNIRSQYKIEVLSFNSIRDKVMNYLITRSNKLGRDEFQIPFNREELAAYLCVNRSALSHELSLMKQDGLIDFRKNYFKILKEKEV